VLAEAWRNTEAMLLAGTSSLAIAQTAMNKLGEELNHRQQLLQQAEIAQVAANRAQQEALAVTADQQAQEFATQQDMLRGQQELLRQQQQRLAAERREIADRNASLEQRIAVFQPLLRLRRFVLSILGRRD
jgi:hypothetical protein